MSYTKVSVLRPSGNPGAGANYKDRVFLVDLDEVQNNGFPARDGNGVVLDGNITMQSGKYMVELYCTLKTLEAGYTVEGDPDKRGFMPKVAFEHPGNSQELMELVSHWTNKNCAVITQACGGGDMRVFGSPCTPLQLLPEAMATSEENKTTFTFEAIVKGQDIPGIYQGTTTLATAEVIAADDATPSVAAGNGRYEVTDNTGANEITTLDDAVHGQVVTLAGMGGSNPSTVTDANDFVLKDGATWTALSGATLTVKAFKDGAASFKFVEVSRT